MRPFRNGASRASALARLPPLITGFWSAAFIRAGQTRSNWQKVRDFNNLHPTLIGSRGARPFTSVAPTLPICEGREIEGAKVMHVLAAPDKEAEETNHTSTQHGRDPGSFADQSESLYWTARMITGTAELAERSVIDATGLAETRSREFAHWLVFFGTFGYLPHCTERPPLIDPRNC